jgi:hypothetical protein
VTDISFYADQMRHAAWEACGSIVEASRAASAPHVLMRPTIFPDGTSWCALLGENINDGIVGFGDTPAEACAAFDKAWREGRTPDAMIAARKGEGATP